MFKCPVHGMSPIAGCCTHVESACWEATALATHVVINGYGIANYVCPDCYVKVKEVAKAFRKQTVEDVLQFDVVDTGICLAHLEEWYRNTGMGTVGDAVADAQRKPPEAP